MKLTDTEKFKLNMYKLGVGIGAVLFSIVYLSVLKDSIESNIGLLLSIPILIVLYLLLKKIIPFQIVKKYFKFVFLCMIIGQLLCGYLLLITSSTWDLSAIYKNTVAMTLGNEINISYFSRYPNNIAILLLLSFFYKIFYAITGSTTIYFAVLLNIIAIDIAILIGIKIAEYLGGDKMKYRFGIFCVLFSPLYLYVPIFYTDTFCLPFMMGAIWLFIQFKDRLKQDGRFSKHSLILAICWITSLYFAIQIKGSVTIILIASIIHLILTTNIKKVIMTLGIMVVCLLTLNLLWGGIVDTTTGITEDDYNRYQFPTTHWIMMGLNGVGNYNSNDVKYTMSFNTYAEKQEATLTELSHRVDEMGTLGVIEQGFKKAIKHGWNYGTYYAERYLGQSGVEVPYRENILHEFVLSKGEYHPLYYLYTQGYYLIIFFIAISSFFYGIIKSFKKREIYFLQVSLLGCLLFFMIWETHPRYMLHFSLILLLLASYVPYNINCDNQLPNGNERYSWIKTILEKIKNRINNLIP